MASLAHVARMNFDALEYLAQPRQGSTPDWVASVGQATVFHTMRDATRTAMHLPSRYRAFALPTAGAFDA